MKTWVKGILALSVAIGVGLGWNHIWSKSAHYLGRRHDSSTITAEADVRSHSFKLQPVDEARNPIFLGDGTIEVKADDVTIGSGTTYGDLLDQLADKSGSAQVNYREALQYFSLLNNQDETATNEMWGTTLNNWLKTNYGEKTFSEGKRILNFNKVNSDKRYTLDVNQLNLELKKKVADTGIEENDVVVPVRFKESNASLDLTIYCVDTPDTFISMARIYGVKGSTVNLEHSELQKLASGRFAWGKLDEPGLVDATWVTFKETTGGENVTFIRNSKVKTAEISYEMPKGYTGVALEKRVVYGHGTDTKIVQSPVINGYKTEDLEVEILFSDIQEKGKKEYVVKYSKIESSVGENTVGNGDGTVVDTDDNNIDTNSSNSNNGNVTATSKPVTPFKVYGKQKLYRYSHANFTNKRRVQAHAKKVKAHAPVFTVVGTTTSSNGAARYQLSDGTHITASSKYVGKLYWNSAYKKLYVTNPKGINTYKSTALGQKVVHVKQGTPLTVKRMAKHNGMTRYQLASGQYISGSKKLVSPTKPKQVKRVKAKTIVRVYKDVNLKKVVKTVKKGSVITVKGWDYSHGNVHHVSGYKRYKVAGGYITANSKYVKIAQ